MAKSNRRARRTKYYELNDGMLVESGSIEEFFINRDGSNVNRVFLARLGPVTSSQNTVVRDGRTWQLHDIEDLRVHDQSRNFIDRQQQTPINSTSSSTSVATDDFISCDFPDLDAFIRELDLMDERVNAALRAGLNAGADIILSEQKRRIQGKSMRLARAISKGSIYTTQSGGLGIKTGYHDDAFKTDADGFNAGVVGMTFEFGRPGTSSNQRRSETMTQTRRGKVYKVRKGAIQPVSHIRAGFDAAVNRAANEVIAEYDRVIDKL